MRLGALEKRILRALEHKGKACYSQDLAWELYNADKGEDDFWNKPTRAFDVSVRRAMRRLESKELLCCGFRPEEYLRKRFNETGRKLMCWLPEHDEPELQRTISGEMVEKVILEILNEAPKRKDEDDVT